MSSILYQEDTHHRILIQVFCLFRPVILQHLNQSQFIQLCSENKCSELKKIEKFIHLRNKIREIARELKLFSNLG